MPSRRPVVMLVAAAWLWVLLSAGGARADGGNGTVCLCTGPQCVPPCPVPGATTTSPLQFPFCPQRPPAIGPFPWEQPSASPRPRSGFPQDAGFLAAAAASPGRTVAPWPAVAAAVCSAFLLLLQ